MVRRRSSPTAISIRSSPDRRRRWRPAGRTTARQGRHALHRGQDQAQDHSCRGLLLQALRPCPDQPGAEKLTRGDVQDLVSLQAVASQTVILTAAVPDLVFIMGKDTDPKKQFYTSACRTLLPVGSWHSGGVDHRATVGFTDEPSRRWSDDLAARESRSSVTSSSSLTPTCTAWLGFPLERGKTDPVVYQTLRAKLLAAGGWSDASKTVTNKVVIRGCNIGQSTDMMKPHGACLRRQAHVVRADAQAELRVVQRHQAETAEEMGARVLLGLLGELTPVTSPNRTPSSGTTLPRNIRRATPPSFKTWIADRNVTERLPISSHTGVEQVLAAPAHAHARVGGGEAGEAVHWKSDFRQLHAHWIREAHQEGQEP